MPELPEVQTVIEGIKPKIINKRIIDFKKYISKLRYPISQTIRKKIKGRLVTAIHRRAKYIIIDLENNQSIVIHLGMSGRIIILGSGASQSSKHTHFIIKFSNKIQLIYIDPRRFGLIKVLPSDSLFKSKTFQLRNI